MSVKYQEHSVILQMILSLIPIVDLWAAYRIKKFRLWVGVYMVDILFWGIWDSYLETPEISDLGFLFIIIELILCAVVMRHFTIKWNKLYAK